MNYHRVVTYTYGPLDITMRVEYEITPGEPRTWDYPGTPDTVEFDTPQVLYVDGDGYRIERADLQRGGWLDACELLAYRVLREAADDPYHNLWDVLCE